MVVNLSNEAKVLIQQYKKALLKSPYRCTKERSNELGKEMLDTIVKKASNADSLQVCPYKTLGQEKDKEGKPQKQNLRWFQYKSPSSSTWGVSVLCDFENDVATVHRIVHSSFIKESTKWILLEDYKNQIRKENTMKRLNITKESYNKSKYFQNKYGKLEYVNESGNVYKTDLGRILKFANEFVDEDVIQANADSITQHGIVTSRLQLNKNQLKEWMSNIGAVEPYEDIIDDVLSDAEATIHLAQPISTVILSMAKSNR